MRGWGDRWLTIVDIPTVTFLLLGVDFGVFQELPTKTQVPLSDAGGIVAFRFQHRGDGDFVGLNQRLILGAEVHRFFEVGAPVVATGEQAIAGGRAYRGRGVGIGETHAFFGEAVDGGGRGKPAVVGDITHAHVVGEDENDVGVFSLGEAEGEQGCEE